MKNFYFGKIRVFTAFLKIIKIITELRNSILGNFNSLEKRIDKGNLLENFIYNEIRNFGEVKYWRTTSKAEIDFILVYKDETIPIEVKTFRKVKRGFEKTEMLYLTHCII